MERHRRLALRTGRSMPAIGLGTWQLHGDIVQVVADALQLGYRALDTSADYGTQAAVREAIRRSKIERSDLFLVTKVPENDEAYEATRRSLGELGQAYADLVLIQRPPEGQPGHDLWTALMRARRDGLARDIGVSNYSTAQIEALVNATREVPVVNQIEWSPFGWSSDMLDYCTLRGIVVQACCPLTRATRLDDDVLLALAAEYGRTPAQILLRWDLQLGVAPVPRATQHDHLLENLAALDFELSGAHMEELEELNEHYSALGALPYV
jgi:2,5-diketo-D-gluconate reductase A